MSFAFASGRVRLHEWEKPLVVDHIVTLLLDLREAGRANDVRPILILIVQGAVFETGQARALVPTAMPAILDGCAELLVVLDRTDIQANLNRSLFTGPSATSDGRKAARLFVSLDQALLYAQGIAPHDVLELQRQGLRRSFTASRKME